MAFRVDFTPIQNQYNLVLSRKKAGFLVTTTYIACTKVISKLITSQASFRVYCFDRLVRPTFHLYKICKFTRGCVLLCRVLCDVDHICVWFRYFAPQYLPPANEVAGR